MRFSIIVKGIAFEGWNYRGAVFACQWIFCIEKQGLAMRFGKGVRIIFFCCHFLLDSSVSFGVAKRVFWVLIAFLH
ncbi:MAG: hypothetical protein NTY86_05595 [Deltaproteobacteria bacterium]|nr:hypothetical protein [Deltaproteobacteria bacterium]